MSIVFEGCDLSGKCTLAKSLHWPMMSRKVITRGRETLDSCMRMTTGFTAWHRWWMTEYVYDRVLRKKHICTLTDMWRFKLLSDVAGTVLIYLNPYDTQIRTRYQLREEEHSIETVLAIKAEYLKFFRDFFEMLPPFFPAEKLTDALRLHEELQQRSEQWANLEMNSWGSLDKGNILICGEKLNDNSTAKYPFDFRTNGGCGRYFFQALQRTDIRPENIHILNLWFRSGGKHRYQKALDFLQPRKIIALGKKVEKELTQFNVHCIQVPHPAYWKRFHYQEFIEYSTLLQEAFNDS